MTTRDLNERMAALCASKGLRFKPWEWPFPWEIEDDEECPYARGSVGADWWPKAQAMRAKLIEELLSKP